MNLLIMGAAGSGKGTMSALIVEAYDIPHISTGDMFREALKSGTELGNQAKTFMDKGLLVPDEVTIAMVKERLGRDDCKKGYLLDGFPRTLVQAKALEKMAAEIDRPLELVINLEVSKEMLVKRITGRRICPTCGSIYHTIYHPPLVEGICDLDGTVLNQRKDDTIEQLEVRLAEHQNNTIPVINYYDELGLVATIDGEQDSELVFKAIEKALNDLH